ncbi:MAG: helix-turn-helix transcriptional regulator [bacterium]|nr:helix-turn-helix transcriptional regulator [bacterium]
MGQESDAIKSRFGKRVLELRKARGWKQAELGKKLGTSGVVVGRYERGEMMPSIEVAQKMAEVFSVTLDYLAGEQEVPNLLTQSEMVERWMTLDALARNDRDRILYVVDSLIREAKTRQAYGAA